MELFVFVRICYVTFYRVVRKGNNEKITLRKGLKVLAAPD